MFFSFLDAFSGSHQVIWPPPKTCTLTDNSKYLSNHVFLFTLAQWWTHSWHISGTSSNTLWPQVQITRSLRYVEDIVMFWSFFILTFKSYILQWQQKKKRVKTLKGNVYSRVDYFDQCLCLWADQFLHIGSRLVFEPCVFVTDPLS